MSKPKINRLFVKSIKSIGIVDYGANAQADILTVKRAAVSIEDATSLHLSGELVCKTVDLKKRRIVAWAYVTHKKNGELADDSGGTTTINGEEVENATARDVVDNAESLKALEDSFYEFLSSGNAGSDDMHQDFNVAKVTGGVVFTPDVIKALGIPDETLPVGVLAVIDVPKNDRGDQLLADIAAGKRRQLSIVAAIKRVPIEDPSDASPDAAKREEVAARLRAVAPSLVSKIDDVAQTFAELTSTEEQRRAVYDLTYRLQESLCSILRDKDADRPTMVAQSLTEFASAMFGKLTEVSKAGAKMSGSRKVKLKAAMATIQEILDEVGGDTPMTDAEKKQLADAQKRVADLEAENTALKAKTPTAEESEEIDLKSLPESVRKRLEANEKATQEAQKRAEKAEEIASKERAERETSEMVAKVRKEMPHTPVKPEEFGAVLKRIGDVAKKEDFDELQRVLRAQSEVAGKSAMFGAIGSDGAGSGADAWAEINAKAKALMATDAALTISKARAIVYEREPELVKKYHAERGAAH